MLPTLFPWNQFPELSHIFTAMKKSLSGIELVRWDMGYCKNDWAMHRKMDSRDLNYTALSFTSNSY